jgi:hypothetical protein
MFTPAAIQEQRLVLAVCNRMFDTLSQAGRIKKSGMKNLTGRTFT